MIKDVFKMHNFIIMKIRNPFSPKVDQLLITVHVLKHSQVNTSVFHNNLIIFNFLEKWVGKTHKNVIFNFYKFSLKRTH